MSMSNAELVCTSHDYDGAVSNARAESRHFPDYWYGIVDETQAAYRTQFAVYRWKYDERPAVSELGKLNIVAWHVDLDNRPIDGSGQ